MNNSFDLEATRIARVNPATGVEIPALSTFTQTHEDATVVGKPISKVSDNRRLTAEFVPKTNLKATGEITSAWTEKSTLDRHLWDTAQKIGPAIKKNKRLIILCFLCAVATLALVLTMNKPHPTLAQTKSPNSINNKPKALTTTTPKQKKEITLIEGASLKDAVDALINGDLIQARKIYLTLSHNDPSNPALQAAVKLLRNQKGK